MQKPIVQAVVLVAVALVLALVSNAVASRDRKLVLPGYYPNATQVPMRESTVTTPAAPKVVVPVQAPDIVLKPVPTPATQTTATQPPAPIKASVPKAATPHPASGHPLPASRGEGASNSDPLAGFTPHPDKPYFEVDYDGAEALQSHGALVLDARRTSVYEQGHIAGARPFSVWESDIDEKVDKLYAERSDPREQLKPILVYCSGGECEDSHMLAQKLWGVQFNNVYVYREGFPDWEKRGGPIHTGATP